MNQDLIPLICLVVGVVVLLLIFIFSAIKIVPEYQRLVVFRLGRSIGARGPGLVLLIPFIDRAVRVDLREQVREIPAQTSITSDNAPIS
ncbi:MAG TPA: SPFH domain-containing protein, partial [Bellilinea sp.]|nr:SPFH domain-containing protein [Bellilinea sp.]